MLLFAVMCLSLFSLVFFNLLNFDSYILGIGSFSEAILDYCANIESAPYPDISKDRFAGEIFTAFEIMFGVWLNSSKEARVSKVSFLFFYFMNSIYSLKYLHNRYLNSNLKQLCNEIYVLLIACQVRLAVVEAFGHMAKLISKEKLEEYLQRLLQGITNLYKRHSEHFIITQVYCI